MEFKFQSQLIPFVVKHNKKKSTDFSMLENNSALIQPHTSSKNLSYYDIIYQKYRTENRQIKKKILRDMSILSSKKLVELHKNSKGESVKKENYNSIKPIKINQKQKHSTNYLPLVQNTDKPTFKTKIESISKINQISNINIENNRKETPLKEKKKSIVSQHIFKSLVQNNIINKNGTINPNYKPPPSNKKSSKNQLDFRNLINLKESKVRQDIPYNKENGSIPIENNFTESKNPKKRSCFWKCLCL